MMALLMQAEPLILGIEHKDKTVLHPIGFIAICVFSLMLIASPRRLALVPVLALLTFVSIAQRVAIFGLDFSFVRILVVAGVLRIFMRGELRGIRRNKMDTAVMLWAQSARDSSDPGLANVSTMLLVILTGIVVSIWYLFCSRFTRRTRFLTFMGFLLAAAVFAGLFRFDGFSGSMVPQVALAIRVPLSAMLRKRRMST